MSPVIVMLVGNIGKSIVPLASSLTWSKVERPLDLFAWRDLGGQWAYLKAALAKIGYYYSHCSRWQFLSLFLMRKAILAIFAVFSGDSSTNP